MGRAEKRELGLRLKCVHHGIGENPRGLVGWGSISSIFNGFDGETRWLVLMILFQRPTITQKARSGEEAILLEVVSLRVLCVVHTYMHTVHAIVQINVAKPALCSFLQSYLWTAQTLCI